MLKIETDRLLLLALDRAQLGLCLNDPAALSAQLDISVSGDIFSEDTRNAISVKITRMLLTDVSLHPWYTYYLIVRKQDRIAMGVCGFKGSPTLFGQVELGYAIHTYYRNQGYMTETVRALVAWAFSDETCQQVTAETLPQNYPSQQVLKKAGLTLERETDTLLFWKIDRVVEDAAK